MAFCSVGCGLNDSMGTAMPPSFQSPQAFEDAIDTAAVNQALHATRLGGSVVHFNEVLSTNDLALEAGMRGERVGVWVADAQTAGRGRGGHSWHSAAGDGLYVSALFTPKLPASAVNLSLVTGLAVWDAIREVSGLTTDIRWPNDLVTRPAASSGTSAQPSKKLGGILVETSAMPVDPATPRGVAMLRYAVIGIGINVAHGSFPDEIAPVASSLRLEGWTPPSRQHLLIALLTNLDANVRRLEDSYARGDSGPGVLTRLAEASTWLRGKRVSVPEDGGYTGTTAGLNEQGFLLVQGDDHRLHTVRSGGVREL